MTTLCEDWSDDSDADNKLGLAGLVVACFTLLFSGVSIWIARKANKTAEAAHRLSEIETTAQVFLLLRSRFIDVFKALPPDYKNPNYHPLEQIPPKPEEVNTIKAYWYNAFDEWYTTNILFESLKKELWDGFFEGAVLSGAKNNSLREVLASDNTTRNLNPMFQQFYDELEALYKESCPDRESYQQEQECIGFECEKTHT